MAVLAGCEPIGLWTGEYVPRQPEVAAPTVMLHASLDGSQEQPVNFSYGRGTADVTYDKSTKTLSWTVTFDNLTGEVKAAHFHGPAPEGQNAGVQVSIGDNGLASPLQGSATLTDEQAADLLAGQWYVNIHTSTYPDGEIRGWLKPGAM